MPRRNFNWAIDRAAHKVPGLRRIPVVKLIAIAEIALLAREHVSKLESDDRRRLLELVRTSRGRARNLSPAEQVELATLVAKAEPRLFARLVADKLSPVGLPRRFVRARR